MRDDGTEDTSDVTGGEGDHELLGLGALLSWLRNDVLVDGLDGLFEAGELHHGVRNLSHPEGLETLVEGTGAFLSLHSREAISESGGVVRGLDSDLKTIRKARRGLKFYLDGFHGSKSNISEELSGSRSDEVKRSSVKESVLFAHGVSVEVLEDFVETKLEATLHGVTDESRSPSSSKSLDTTFGDGDLHTLAEGGVLGGVDLHSALDQIKGNDGGVGDTARSSTTNHALGIVFGRAEFDLK